MHRPCVYPQGWGVTQITYWQGCVARGLKPLPISNDFSSSKMADFDGFFKIFPNWDTFLRVFLPPKWQILPFLRNSNEMAPSSEDFFFFFTKMEPMSKDFWWKSTVAHLGSTFFGVCLNMWVTPPHRCLSSTTAVFILHDSWVIK